MSRSGGGSGSGSGSSGSSGSGSGRNDNPDGVPGDDGSSTWIIDAGRHDPQPKGGDGRR